MTLQEEMASVSLPELAYLRRLQKYQKRKSDQIEHRLQRLEKLCEIRMRLIRCAQHLQYGLSEAIQSGNKKNFTLLYQAFRTAERACQEYDAQFSKPTDPSRSSVDPSSGNFLDQVSPGTRDALLEFLSRLASDPNFLLDRLMSLSHSELTSFLNPLSQSPIEQSTFGNPSRKFHNESNPGALKDFLDFSRHDVLSFLLRLVMSKGSNNLDEPTVEKNHAWGEICASLLSHQKQGSDKFVVAVMNAYSQPMEKRAMRCLETWLLETLQDGAFLLDKPDKHSFRMRIQAREGIHADDEATERFFSKAIKKLLEVLKHAPLTGAIPATALALGRSIVAGLKNSPRQQQAAPYFLCTRWLFASYLTTLIRSPESRGLCLSYHISPNARQRILNEIALRAQRMAFDVAYTWKHSAPVDADLLGDVEAVVNLFRPSLESGREDSGIPTRAQDTAGLHASSSHITICPSDLINLIHVLFPEQRSNLFQSTSSLAGSTLRSSASSVSGISLFRTTSPCGSASFSDNGPSNAVEDTSSQGIANIQRSSSDNNSDVLDGLCGDTMTLRLREACNELEVTTEYDTGAENCDPFSQGWTTLQVSTSGHVESAAGISRTDAFSSLESASASSRGYVGTDTPRPLDGSSCCLIESGMLPLLDDFVPAPDVEKPLPTSSIALRASLIESFEHAASSCYQQGDFSKAHSFFLLTSHVRSLSYQLTVQALVPMLHQLAESLRQSTKSSQDFIRSCDSRFESLNRIGEQQLAELKVVSRVIDRLREKMWFITDVQSASQYEDLRRIGSALRVMGYPVRPSLEKPQPPLRHRGGSRPLSQDLQLKAEAATLELLSAPVERGGPNKLGDPQVKVTLDWMQTQGVENICKAEERIHRFCMEISRCVESLVGDTISDNPILWSSELYQRQRSLSASQHRGFKGSDTEETAMRQLASLYTLNKPNLSISRPPSQFRSISQPLFPANAFDTKLHAHDSFGSRSPTLTNKSSATFWSSFSAGTQSPSSATSLPSRAFSPALSDRPSSSTTCDQHSQSSFLQELRKNLTALLLSDFGLIFRDGSETDRALRDPLKGKSIKNGMQTTLARAMDQTNSTSAKRSIGNSTADGSNHSCFRPETSSVDLNKDQDAKLFVFDFEEVFRTLLKTFELQPGPFQKLDALYELQSMLEACETGPYTPNIAVQPFSNNGTDQTPMAQGKLNLRIDTFVPSRNIPGQDMVVKGFHRLFQNPELRPRTLFRDLQYIISLVPLRTLDSTARGRAFWNATVAALDVKQEILQTLIETADQIVSYHTFNRGHSRVTSAAQAKRDSANFPPPSTSPKPHEESAANGGDVSHLSMSDAATLLQITAKEGIPAAQRELATLYLTHPDLLGVCIAPFSRPRDVFKDGPVGAASTGKKDRDRMDRDRYDPVAMAMAQHWMELSAKGGDGPATKYLRAKDEFERIP